MQSLVLMDDSYGDMGHSRPTGPATGDRNLLPLGLVQKPSAGGAANGTARQHKQMPPAGPAVDGCPSTLPPPPEGPPVMVLFPATLHLAIFFVPAPPATLVSAAMTLLAIPLLWGWGVVSTAGAGSGIAAGFAVGLGVRSRPVGGWGYAALVGCSSTPSLPRLAPTLHVQTWRCIWVFPGCRPPAVWSALSILLRGPLSR